ncbi:NF-kappa-B inhibitor-like protein 1 [Myxocyprinus asiaticus]|uniref:NF-kappa-B inhibitor-like protein 1 n=1 Tax=Myxocyprinus asiaticus TaxID=70543 RepID=UPI0022215392|nr:NF-kappa-B inhibitor-like protein 1 [Myxocyprinus asiaticus]
MMNRKQRRVLRYVEEGSLLKLKSYLRKHKDLELNFTQGKRHRGPLHVVCSHGDDAILRLLLKRGADPLQTDRNGETPLHLAANRALKYGKRVYDDLVVPLQKHCPEAMEISNKAGVTPRDLLQWMKSEQKQGGLGKESPCAVDPEQQWREKLLGECQDEFFETFGQYDDDFLYDDKDEEDFVDWAERIRREYVGKQRAREQRQAACLGNKRSKGRKETEEDERSRRELMARLEREHAEYLQRAARKEEETRQGRKRRYEERCAATFQSSSSKAPEGLLGYDDIPWPAPRGSPEDMVAVMLHGADRSDVPTLRKVLRRQQALWHPDKFSQRCGGRLVDCDRQKILDTVTALSQELNRLAQSLR